MLVNLNRDIPEIEVVTLKMLDAFGWEMNMKDAALALAEHFEQKKDRPVSSGITAKAIRELFK